MNEKQRVQIIGIGDDGFEGMTTTARDLIQRAEVMVGSVQALDSATEFSGRRIETKSLDSVVEAIAKCDGQRIVVLATGDPLFYGMARFLCDRLGKDHFDVVPHVSSMQLAFARVKESWDEAYLTNLATQELDRVVEKIRTSEKVGLFTSPQWPPAAVAQKLLDRQIDYFLAYVCENLGSPDERVTQGELTEVAQQQFSELNVMILVRKPDVPDRPTDMVGKRMFGNPDESFLHTQPKRGLATPAEVRSMALAEMDLGMTSVVWDVGAGSGSVAVEAAMISRGGTVYAIEMDPEDYQLISENADRFGVTNLVGVLGKAPEAWEDLPDPDSIFVGGTGRSVSHIVELEVERLKPGGRLVATMGSVENVVAVREALRRCGVETSVWMISVARGTQQLESLRFEAINPTFLIGAVKA